MRILCFSDFIFKSSYEITPALDALMRSADVICVNFEAPIRAEGDVPVDKGINLYQLDDCSAFLERYPLKVANLGNNHITDYGDSALLRTIDFLNDHGVQTCGAGATLEEALAPAVVHVDGKSLGVWGFGWHFTEALAAGDDEPGVAPLSMKALRRALDGAPRFDHQLAYMHYGIEYEDYPDPYQKHVSEWLTGRGAVDAVIGTHPHCIQGWESFESAGRHRAVFYSLGNFMLPQAEYDGKKLTFPPKSEAAYGALLELGESNRYEAVPLHIDDANERLDVLDGNARQEAEAFLATLSAPLSSRGILYLFRYLRMRNRWHLPVPVPFEALTSAQVATFRAVEHFVGETSRRLGLYDLIRSALSRQVR